MTEALLEFVDVAYTHPGREKPTLSGIHLTIPSGQKVALLGRNGAGKSTLLWLANGLLRPSSGSVLVKGRRLDYSRKGLLAARAHVGLVFQNADDQLFSSDLAQDISFGPMNLGLSSAEVRRRVAEAARQCGVSELLDTPTHTLSGGQKARAALAGVLAMEPSCILADEIMAGLDPWMQVQVFEIFDRLASAGRSVLLVTHDQGLARHWADQVVVMADGRVVLAGPPEEAFNHPAATELMGPAQPWARPWQKLEGQR